MAPIGLAIISKISSQRLIALWHFYPYLYAHDLHRDASCDRHAHHVHGAYVSCRTTPNPEFILELMLISICGR
jgi:hypothetical protein